MEYEGGSIDDDVAFALSKLTDLSGKLQDVGDNEELLRNDLIRVAKSEKVFFSLTRNYTNGPYHDGHPLILSLILSPKRRLWEL